MSENTHNTVDVDNAAEPVESNGAWWRAARWSALAAIVLLALAMRWPGHATMSMWYDEGFSMVLIRQPWPKLLHVIRTDDHPPLYYFLLRPWMALRPHDIAWGRRLSILLGVLTVALAYFFARDLFRNKASPVGSSRREGLENGQPRQPRSGVLPAIVAACFAALAPYMIHYSHELRMYALFGLLATAAYWMTWRLRERWDWRVAAVWVAAATGLLYTQYYGLLAVAGMFLCLGTWRFQQTRNWGRTLTALAFLGAGSFVLFLPWLGSFFLQVLNNTSGGVHSSQGPASLGQEAAYFMDPFLGRIPQLPFEGGYEALTGRAVAMLPQTKITLFIILMLALFAKALWELRHRRQLLIFLGWGLAFPLALTLFYQYALHGRFFGRLLIVYWTLFFAVAAYGAVSFRSLWVNVALCAVIAGFYWSSARAYWTVDERSVTRFVYDKALAKHPGLPVYHVSGWSLLPLLARDKMNSRHQFLVHQECSLIQQILVGRERIIKPSEAADRIQYPCLLVVFKEVYINNDALREREKADAVRRFRAMFFPPGVRVEIVYNLGERKWCQVLRIDRP